MFVLVLHSKSIILRRSSLTKYYLSTIEYLSNCRQNIHKESFSLNNEWNDFFMQSSSFGFVIYYNKFDDCGVEIIFKTAIFEFFFYSLANERHTFGYINKCNFFPYQKKKKQMQLFFFLLPLGMPKTKVSFVAIDCSLKQ